MQDLFCNHLALHASPRNGYTDSKICLGPGWITFRRARCQLRQKGESQVKKGQQAKLEGQICFYSRIKDNGPEKVNVQYDKIKDTGGALKPRSNVDVVVEILTNGAVHARQHGRLPYIGPYSDWQDCLGFAIRIEFQTPQGMRYHYLQRAGEQFKGGIPSSYAHVSSLLAAFKGITYNTTNGWRKDRAIRPQRVRLFKSSTFSIWVNLTC